MKLSNSSPFCFSATLRFAVMKRLLFVLSSVFFFSFIFSSVAYAGDCFQDPIYDRDWNAEVTTGAFVRDVACMDASVVVTTLSVGEIVHVIAETDGWYKIQRSDGTVGWVGQWLIQQTNKSMTGNTGTAPSPEPTNNSPLFDVVGHEYEGAVWYIYYAGIVGGYPDGSYQPDRVLNRAELLKIIVEAVYDNEFEAFAGQNCFSDVPSSEWYAKYVCFAKNKGVVGGYADGTFRPSQEISFVEALKIAMEAFAYEYAESTPWYKDLVVQASSYNFIPLDVQRFAEGFKRGQMAELITRILKYENAELDAYLGDKAAQNVGYSDLK